MPKNTDKTAAPGDRSIRRDSPALTLTEPAPFRVRLGGAHAGRSPKAKAFIGRIKTLVRQHGGAQGGSRHRSTFGVGGSAAARLKVRAHPQRVVIKARVVKHAIYTGKGGAPAALRQHTNYLGRAGAAEDGGRGVAFDADQDLSAEDLSSFREGMVPDRHHFRFIVSPESGAALDLKSFARELVTEMQVDLGTKLTWIGMAHYDTDEPHLHLMIRGTDAHGGDLVISRDYMSHGMRLQAMEVATRRLGPRLPKDIERAIHRDLKADRVTGIDLSLVAQAALHPQGWVSALRRQDGDAASERQRLNTVTRLTHLESLGLAREISPGVWQPDIELVSRLRALSTRGDIIKTLHAKMRSNLGAQIAIVDKDHPPAMPVVGRVVARGVSDEMTDAEHVIVETRDGAAVLVALGGRSERPGQEAAVGSIVRVSVAPRQDRAADRNIARAAAQNDGIYDPARHLETIHHSHRLPHGASASDYVAAHVKRAHALASRGHLESLDEGRFAVPTDLLAQVAMRPAVGRDAGAVLQIERLSALSLEIQTTTQGVTWLDRELASNAQDVAPAVGASGFARDFEEATFKRLQYLQDQGLARLVDGHISVGRNFLDELYRLEIEAAGRRLSDRYGGFAQPQTGRNLEGRIAAIEELPSGPHAVVTMQRQFALVPATDGLERQVGRTLNLTLSRGRSLCDEADPMKLSIRFQAVDLKPSRKLPRFR